VLWGGSCNSAGSSAALLSSGTSKGDARVRCAQSTTTTQGCPCKRIADFAAHDTTIAVCQHAGRQRSHLQSAWPRPPAPPPPQTHTHTHTHLAVKAHEQQLVHTRAREPAAAAVSHAADVGCQQHCTHAHWWRWQGG
jgi:hypothetical protein